jgi:hypothetical protein
MVFGQLPALDIQRRLISWTLQRALGRYFQLGSLPAFHDGSLVLSDLHLNIDVRPVAAL